MYAITIYNMQSGKLEFRLAIKSYALTTLE